MAIENGVADDYQGYMVVPGDYIAYATRDGNSAGMRLARVLEVLDDKMKVRAINSGWRGWGEPYNTTIATDNFIRINESGEVRKLLE